MFFPGATVAIKKILSSGVVSPLKNFGLAKITCSGPFKFNYVGVFGRVAW